ncbi:septal ring lytic transglycosylase RlpA family protein [Desulfovibrio sp.]|uniref:septal ring lytic transglycosylase RlpA family protein n=1 Tax=Desulfovibrio sp. TaxID=885 RepID=UPI0023D5A077|nr:septal ring lytic transglycosylase RlpA family protein [Desulfovibrio sp.]MDE7240511.1 septal ring lytic transglycosylase RlpA family protein [Desulfovibrio sp.]
MKYLRWLSIGTALALCLCIALPSAAQAAASAQAKNRKTTQAQAVKKAAKASARNKHGVKSAKKSGRHKSVAKKGADHRDLWLQRARQGDLLSGKASWYGPDFHNKATASGLSYDMYTFTAAHRTLPMGTVVKVTDQDNGKSVMVCVTDRGPFVRGRIIDLSYAAAQQINLGTRGVGRVNLEVVSDETGTPLKADQAYFIRYGAHGGASKVGPFRAFADAAAMHEALRQAHPEAEVVLDSTR